MTLLIEMLVADARDMSPLRAYRIIAFSQWVTKQSYKFFRECGYFRLLGDSNL